MVSNAEYLVAGLIAVAISLLAVLVKYGNKGFRRDWLIAGLAIGILSPIIGLLMGGSILQFLYPDGPFAQLALGLLIFIFSCIGYTYFKKESSRFFLKVLFFSFAVLIFVAFALFLTMQSDTGLTVIIEKIPSESLINGMNDYVIINTTENELDENPLLKRMIIDCRDSNICDSKPDLEEWISARGILEKKEHESGYLFTVLNESSEEDLNMGIFLPSLRNAFESRGLPISENAIISQASYQEVKRWDIMDKKHLFDINNAELETELNKIEITNGGVIKEAKIPKLEQIFRAKGFLPSESYTLYRDPEKWIFSNDTATYEIRNENGTLKVFTQEKWTYEIVEENGKLNIYDVKLNNNYLLKFSGNYYRIEQRWEE